MAEPPPEPGNAPETGIKRSQTDREATSPDPNIKEEPDVKKQKLEETPTSVQQSHKVIDIDPAGDLLIVFEKTTYKADSYAIKRALPKFYKECVDQRPSGDSSWVFKGISKTFEGATEVILNLVHANLDRIPQPMHWVTLHNTISVAREYEVIDRFSGSLKQWYQGLPPQCPRSIYNERQCGKLWMAYHLGLEEEFKALQRWAIFNLHDDGKGGLWTPLVQTNGDRLEFLDFSLAETAVADRLIRLRSQAVTQIMGELMTAELALFPSGSFGKDGRINNKLGGCACLKCMDLWSGCLRKSLLRPHLFLPSPEGGFPSLSHKIEVQDHKFDLPLERLCAFVEQIQRKMDGYLACGRKGQAACYPPQLIGRKAVEDLINQGLQAPLGAT